MICRLKFQNYQFTYADQQNQTVNVPLASGPVNQSRQPGGKLGEKDNNPQPDELKKDKRNDAEDESKVIVEYRQDLVSVAPC